VNNFDNGPGMLISLPDGGVTFDDFYWTAPATSRRGAGQKGGATFGDFFE